MTASAAGRAVTAGTAPGWTAKVDAATPPQRDRTIDALRAVAIVGVVLGHWLVSAVVSDPYQPAALHGASPLSSAPWFTPASWFLQTLAPFFVCAGYAAARSRTARPRFGRMLRPVLALAVVWVPAMLLLDVVGAPASTRHLVLSLVTHPLWFLAVYVILTALTPLLRRRPWTVALAAVALVAVSDVTRPHGLLMLLVVPVGWAAPYACGIALAQNRLPRWAGWPLLVSGVCGGAALVLAAGYPASAVGVPGDHRSNLDPPSLFAMALAAAQLGVFLLVRPWLARVLRRPAVWAPVAGLNLVAVTVFCWHQTALLLVTFAGLLVGHPAGLLDAPGAGWPLHRLAWLIAFAVVLAGLTVTFKRYERPSTRRGSPSGLSSRSAAGSNAEGVS